jgi:hypothetical protein
MGTGGAGATTLFITGFDNWVLYGPNVLIRWGQKYSGRELPDLLDELPLLQDFCKGKFGRARAHEHIQFKAIDFEFSAGGFPGKTFDLANLHQADAGPERIKSQFAIYIFKFLFNRGIHKRIKRLVGPHDIPAIFLVEIKCVTCVRTFYPGSVKSGFGIV